MTFREAVPFDWKTLKNLPPAPREKRVRLELAYMLRRSTPHEERLQIAWKLWRYHKNGMELPPEAPGVVNVTLSALLDDELPNPYHKISLAKLIFDIGHHHMDQLLRQMARNDSE